MKQPGDIHSVRLGSLAGYAAHPSEPRHLAGAVETAKIINVHVLRGFTLIELLVVVAIIAILAALLLPSLGRAREMGKRAACLGNLRSLNLATRMYLDDNNNFMYPAILNYGMYTSFLSSPGGIGYLYSGNYIKDPKVFFCPSSVDTVPANWDAGGFTSEGFRKYFANPSAGNSGITGSHYTYNHLWLGGGGGVYLNNYFCEGVTNTPYRVCYSGNENLPLLADACINLSTTQRFINHARRGLNVAFLDGSVRWVDASKFGPHEAVAGEFITWGNVSVGNAQDRFWLCMKKSQ